MFPKLSNDELRILRNDLLLEHGILKIESLVLVDTATYAYAGKLQGVTPDIIILSEAAWVANTGRRSEFFKSATGMIDRAEYESMAHETVIIQRTAVVSITTLSCLRGPLPTKGASEGAVAYQRRERR